MKTPRAAAQALLGELENLVNHGLAQRARSRLEQLLRDTDSPFIRVQLKRHAQPLMDRACAEDAPPIGVSWFPVELEPPFAEADAGLIKVRVSAGQATGLSPAIQDALAAGARQAGAAPGGLTVQFTPELDRTDGLQVEGCSLQLAVALAAASALRKQPLPAHTAWSGAVDDGGRLSPPSRTSQQTKRGAVHAAWGARGRLCCPTTTLGDALQEALAATDPRATPVDSLFAVMQHLDTGRYAEAEAMAQRIMNNDAEFGARPRYTAALRVAIAASYRADGAAVEALWQGFEALAHRATDEDRAAFAALRAIAALDRWDLDTALSHLNTELDRLSPILAEPHTRERARVHLFGTRARLRSARGDHAGALADGAEALRCAPADQHPRSLGDLALWHLRAGEPERALERIREARAQLPAQPGGPQATTATYLTVFAARAALALGDRQTAHAEWRALTIPAHAPEDLLLSQAELAARLGLHGPARRLLSAFDAARPDARDRPILGRLRARAEARLPDAGPLEPWTHGWDLTQLERLPY